MKPIRSLLLIVVIYYVFWALVPSIQNIIKPDRKVKFVFVDVGQGDGVFVKAGSKKILVDVGSFGTIDDFVNSLFRTSVCGFDAVFVTHLHEDHVGGLERLVQKCKIGILRFNDVGQDKRADGRFRTEIAKNSQINNFSTRIFAGEKFNFDEVSFYVFWPTKNYLDRFRKLNLETADLNNVSTVILAKYKDIEVLLTGDAESSVLAQTDLATLKSLVEGPLEVLKVPHHGSKNGLSRDLLELLNPVNCVVSVGKNNSYGHPDAQTLDLATKYCGQIYRTDLDGNVEFGFN